MYNNISHFLGSTHLIETPFSCAAKNPKRGHKAVLKRIYCALYNLILISYNPTNNYSHPHI